MSKKQSAKTVKAAPAVEVIDVAPAPPRIEEASSTALAVVSPMTILQQAVAAGAGVDQLERLLTLQERWEATLSRKSFDAAMAALRGDLPTIVKRSQVDFTTAKGRTNYRYEDLPSVTEAVSPAMAKHGLSFRWRTDSTKPGVISVTCIVSHAAGHSEETTLSCQADDSGNKNDIQAIGSAVTYLQRYTLKAAIGIAAGADDDGASRRPRKEDAPRETQTRRPEPEERHVEHSQSDAPITVGYKTKNADGSYDKHYGQLERLITIQNKSGRDEREVSMWLKRVYGYESRKDIRRRHYDEIVAAIESKAPLPLGEDREPGSDDE